MNTSRIYEIAVKYAKNVISGKQVAGKLIIQSCKRFLKDVKSKNIVVDHEALNIFDDLTTLLIFPKTKTPVNFEPFQYFIIVNIIGLYYKTGERKYTRSYLQLARKNGKTALLPLTAT